VLKDGRQSWGAHAGRILLAERCMQVFLVVAACSIEHRKGSKSQVSVRPVLQHAVQPCCMQFCLTHSNCLPSPQPLSHAPKHQLSSLEQLEVQARADMLLQEHVQYRQVPHPLLRKHTGT
jgi:hypothetical protein